MRREKNLQLHIRVARHHRVGVRGRDARERLRVHDRGGGDGVRPRTAPDARKPAGERDEELAGVGDRRVEEVAGVGAQRVEDATLQV